MTTGPQGREGGLDPRAMAALRAFRTEEDMPPAAQARVWARLAASTSEEASWAKRHVQKRRSEWLWAGLAVAAAAAVLLASRAGVLGPLTGARDGAGAAAYVERASETSAPTEPSRAAVETGSNEHVQEDMPVETGDMNVSGDMASETGARTGAARATGRGGEARGERPRARAEAERGAGDEASTRSLAQEAEALARAQAAISGGRAGEALAILADYAQRFPAGALREEHDALRALALCASGRAAEGKAAAELFLRAHGGSALAERVREGCPGG